MFSSPQQALDWLKGKVSALYATRGPLQDAYGRALAGQSRASTTAERQGTAIATNGLCLLLENQGQLEKRVSQLLPSSWIPEGLGLAPVVIAGAVTIALASAVAVHLAKTQAYRQTLSLIETGKISPEQAMALEQSTGSVFGADGLSGVFGNLKLIVLLAVGGYALLLFGPTVAYALRGKR